MATYVTTVRWADVDPNAHARNTAYSEYATDARLALLASHGFTVARFHELRLGPVVLTEQLEYRRELRIGDEVAVTVELAGLSPSAHRWVIRHRVLHGDTLAATDQLAGGWIDLGARRLCAPPADLADVLRALPRTTDYEDLPDGASH